MQSVFIEYSMCLLFLSSGGASTGTDVAMWLGVFVFTKNWVRYCRGQASTRVYNTSVQRQGYSPSVQQQYKS